MQLIDAESGAHLWAERFDTDRRELANAQDEIAVHLAETLGMKLVAAEVARSEQRKAVDPDAARLRHARTGLVLPTHVSNDGRKTLDRLSSRSLQNDPQSNDARIGLALVLAGTANVSAGLFLEIFCAPSSWPAEAIERDPTNSRAHEAMGRVRLIQKNRLREAQIEFETALALDRSSLNAFRPSLGLRTTSANPRLALPRGKEACGSARAVRARGTFSAQLGNCHLTANRLDLATDYLIKARAAAPQIWWLHLYLAGALGLKGISTGGGHRLPRGSS